MTRFWCNALALVVLGALPVAAADETVPTYTNADLERFGPPSAPVADAADRAERDRAFVEAFLDRAYARLDADRGHDLSRDAIRRVGEPEDCDDRSAVVPFFPFRRLRLSGFARPKPRPARPPGARVEASRSGPIHARPPLSVVGHGTAGALSGRDAVPRRR